MIDRTPGICACKDESSTFLYANHAFKQLYGLDPEQDVRGLTDYDLPHEAASNADAFRQQDKHVIKRQISITTLNVHRFQGESRAFLVCKKPFADSESKIRGVWFQGIEITMANAGAMASAQGGLLHKHVAISGLSQGSFVIADSDSNLDMTTRESEVLYFLLRGGTAKRIANALSISTRTAEQYIDALKNKFGVRTKSDLIERAISMGYWYFAPNSLYSKRFAGARCAADPARPGTNAFEQRPA